MQQSWCCECSLAAELSYHQVARFPSVHLHPSPINKILAESDIALVNLASTTKESFRTQSRTEMSNPSYVATCGVNAVSHRTASQVPFPDQTNMGSSLPLTKIVLLSTTPTVGDELATFVCLYALGTASKIT